jgi:Uri superfamily endonuclease
MKSYVLLIELENEKRIGIGKLGNIKFKKGFYVYVGSAKKNLIQRVERHYSKEKKLHWHIDYLLESSKIIESYLSSKAECEIAGELSEDFSGINISAQAIADVTATSFIPVIWRISETD